MPIPQSFKAAMVNEPRSQHVVSSRSVAQLKPGEIGIKINATAINPVDWKMRDFDELIDEYPAILGSDAAGVVVSVAPNVLHFAIGDRVFFQGIIGSYDSCTFQQYCKMPSALVSKTPGNISDEQAAGISLTTVAAVCAFYDRQGRGLTPPWQEGGEHVGKGKAVVIVGGASSVGQYAIQLARLSGFERIITNASAANHEWLKKLGAHIVLDRAQSSPEDFKAAIGEVPLDFVFDSISLKETQVLSVQIVQAATKILNNVAVVLFVVHPAPLDPDAAALGRSKEPKVEVKQVLGIGSSPELRYLSEPMARSLGGENGYIANGLFTPNRPRVIPGGLGALEKALALNKNGVSGEKVVILPFDM